MKSEIQSEWSEYELIDSGGGEKLERFGKYNIRRPEPQALWDRRMGIEQWELLADATFTRDSHSNDSDKGNWTVKKGMSQQWQITFVYKGMKIILRLGLTAFKHLGVFPEQAENWKFIFDRVSAMKATNPKILNLFAYTGAASLAAKAAGAEVVHVDSVRQVVNWAGENMRNSNLDHIKWVVEDAFKFVSREARRGSLYHGIILDPPAYGRGPQGEKWILENQINDLLKLCKHILKQNDNLLVINMYSMGFSSILLESLVNQVFPWGKPYESGELFVMDKGGRKLPLGIFYRA